MNPDKNISLFPEDSIKFNLIRSLLYEYLGKRNKSLQETFVKRFAEWMDSRKRGIPSDSISPVAQMCDQLYEYLSSRDETHKFSTADFENILNSTPSEVSSGLLEISEHIEEKRLDLWGTVEYDEDEIVGFIDDNLIGVAPLWKEALHLAARAARCNFPVLITGETGTGKELVAHQIHAYSTRRQRDCVIINCGALPENLLESELFGYTGGAFTGAVKRGKSGWIEKAAGGTLVLDEISELSESAQAALLRALQQGELQKIGGEITKVDFRLITISNQNIEDLVEEGLFRRDLYYRIAVIQIHLPLLRDRREDVEELAHHFLVKYINANSRLSARSISDEAVNVLKAYTWHGNVRELENVIARAMVLCTGDIIESKHLVFSQGTRVKNYDNNELSDMMHLLDDATFKRIKPSVLAGFLSNNREMITSGTYARSLNISASTARRHLNELVEKGLLIRRGSKKGAYYILKSLD